jgi:hypothetical protein
MNHGHTGENTSKADIEGPGTGSYHGLEKPSAADLKIPVKEYPFGSTIKRREIEVDSPAPKDGYC